MTTEHFNKLADALKLKGQSWQELKDREAACEEAARILRSAAGVDVAGLMALFDKAADARADWLNRSHPAPYKQRYDAAFESRAALESAIRMMAARPKQEKAE